MTREWLTYRDYTYGIFKKRTDAKTEWRRIKNAKASGVKNPYFNFINNLPEGLTGLANKV